MLKLKAGRSIAKAYTVEEKERMLAEAKKARSPHLSRHHAPVSVERSLPARNAKGNCSEMATVTQSFEGVSPQKSTQSVISDAHRGVKKSRKSKILIGSSGRTRTYNPSVNRGIINRGVRMLSTE